jgi:hypothetical protein
VQPLKRVKKLSRSQEHIVCLASAHDTFACGREVGRESRTVTPQDCHAEVVAVDENAVFVVDECGKPLKFELRGVCVCVCVRVRVCVCE